MKNGLREFLIGLAIGIPFVVAGVLLRPFWHSAWGMPTFAAIFWVVLSLTLGWGGKGKPYSLLFGVVAGTAILLYAALSFLIMRYTGINHYIATIPFFLLIWYSTKFKFVENRMRQLDPDRDP